MSDFFHPSVTHEMHRDAFCVMAAAPQHTYMLLTKRPENISKCTFKFGEVLGAWLGCTVENQEQADKRIPFLLDNSAPVHFVSCEPLLGLVSFNAIPMYGETFNVLYGHRSSHPEWAASTVARISWVICGGESGGKARPMHPDWARSLRDQCAAARAPFMFKQWGEWGTRYEVGGVPHFEQFQNHEHWVNKASSWVQGGTCLDSDGKICKCGADFQTAKFPVTIMHHVGKARTGRLLDGVEHNEIPEARI